MRKGKRRGGFGRKFEDKVCVALESLTEDFKRSGAVKLPYTMPPQLYSPDITIETPSKVLYIEVKSYLDSDDQRKMRAVKKCNPDLDIKFVFLNASKIVQGSKMTHAQWCAKYDFDWAENEVPKEWLL